LLLLLLERFSGSPDWLKFGTNGIHYHAEFQLQKPLDVVEPVLSELSSSFLRVQKIL
jgi:hypothetical protein